MIRSDQVAAKSKTLSIDFNAELTRRPKLLKNCHRQLFYKLLKLPTILSLSKLCIFLRESGFVLSLTFDLHEEAKRAKGNKFSCRYQVMMHHFTEFDWIFYLAA